MFFENNDIPQVGYENARKAAFGKRYSYAFTGSTDLIDVLSQLKCNGSIET